MVAQVFVHVSHDLEEDIILIIGLVWFGDCTAQDDDLGRCNDVERLGQAIWQPRGDLLQLPAATWPRLAAI